MSTPSFTAQIRQATDSIWEAIFRHPFVTGIGDGSLSEDRYIHYLKQDYLYLVEFSRVFAIASAKTGDLSRQAYFAELLQLTLQTEMELHRKTCETVGVSREELERTEPALITTAYTNLLVRTCYEGTFKDILAVLRPCASGYIEIAEMLKNRGLPSHAFYRDWIETYCTPEFKEYDERLGMWLDEAAAESCRSDRERLLGLYRLSSRFELLFFDMGWRMEFWTDVVQDRYHV